MFSKPERIVTCFSTSIVIGSTTFSTFSALIASFFSTLFSSALDPLDNCTLSLRSYVPNLAFDPFDNCTSLRSNGFKSGLIPSSILTSFSVSTFLRPIPSLSSLSALGSRLTGFNLKPMKESCTSFFGMMRGFGLGFGSSGFGSLDYKIDGFKKSKIFGGVK